MGDAWPDRSVLLFAKQILICTWFRPNSGLFVFGKDTILESPGIYTQDPAVAQSWGIENKRWFTDSSDPKSVKAQAVAKKIIGVVGKTKVGTFQSTVVQALALTVNTLFLYKVGSIQHTVGDYVKAILDKLWAGKITAAEAMAQYEKIVAQFPQIFT